MYQRFFSLLSAFIIILNAVVVAGRNTDFRVNRILKKGFKERHKDDVKSHTPFASAPYDSYWKYATKVPKTVVASCILKPSIKDWGEIELEQDFYFEGLKAGVSSFKAEKLEEDENIRCGYDYVGDEL